MCACKLYVSKHERTHQTKSPFLSVESKKCNEITGPNCTNIPLIETVNIIIEEVFSNTTSYNGYSKTQFKKLLMLSCNENLFLFNGSLYKQHEGVQMGGSMGPVLANIFMCHMENKWLQQCTDICKPMMYRRYVDDTFLLFHNLEHVQSFHTYMNAQHPNIKFTIEMENKFPCHS